MYVRHMFDESIEECILCVRSKVEHTSGGRMKGSEMASFSTANYVRTAVDIAIERSMKFVAAFRKYCTHFLNWLQFFMLHLIK